MGTCGDVSALTKFLQLFLHWTCMLEKLLPAELIYTANKIFETTKIDSHKYVQLTS